MRRRRRRGSNDGTNWRGRIKSRGVGRSICGWGVGGWGRKKGRYTGYNDNPALETATAFSELDSVMPFKFRGKEVAAIAVGYDELTL